RVTASSSFALPAALPIFANGDLFLTVIFTALAVWVLGLAVLVTASYIIAAAITAPAMISLGVPDVAAHMFIFYYAVLSEVSPPRSEEHTSELQSRANLVC